MDLTFIVDFIKDFDALIIGIFTVFFAALLWITNRNATIHRGILELHKRYSLREIGDAIRKLHNFYRNECNSNSDNLGDEFISSLPNQPNEKHYQSYNVNDSRRLVVGFYMYMADIYDHNILCRKRKSKKLLFGHWTNETLKIIPDILIPLDTAYANHLSLPVDTMGMKKLKKLYEAAEKYCDP